MRGIDTRNLIFIVLIAFQHAINRFKNITYGKTQCYRNIVFASG